MDSPTTLFRHDAAQTCETGETEHVSNEQFLIAVFGNDLTDARPIVVSFEGNPATAPSRSWLGAPWTLASGTRELLAPTANNYFSLATFRPDEAGRYRRQKARFHSLHAVMLDDIGTKVDLERLTLPPSWLLETSPGNYQAGYLLREPLGDGSIADRLMNAIVAAGLCDPGANGPRARLARLPVAVNGKHTTPFRCRMTTWSPDLRYSVEELVDGLQLEIAPAGRPARQRTRSAQPRPSDGDPVWIPRPEENAVLVALRDRGLYKAPLGDGKHDVTCPWVSEHTGAVDGGTAYFEPNDNWPIGGFKCLHGHCADRHVRDLLRLLDVEINSARMKPTIRIVPGEIHRVVDAAEHELATVLPARRAHRRGRHRPRHSRDPGAGDKRAGARTGIGRRRHLGAVRRAVRGMGANRSAGPPRDGAIRFHELSPPAGTERSGEAALSASGWQPDVGGRI